jgi:hypothetical protein
MPHLKLVHDEPETEPPATFQIRDWRSLCETDAPMDAIEQVEQAFNRAQQSLDLLSQQLDEAESLPFPGRTDPDDNGPWAA